MQYLFLIEHAKRTTPRLSDHRLFRSAKIWKWWISHRNIELWWIINSKYWESIKIGRKGVQGYFVENTESHWIQVYRQFRPHNSKLLLEMQNFSNLLNQIENKRVCRFQSDICCNTNDEFKCNTTFSMVDSTTDNNKINNHHNLHQIHDNNHLNNAYANSNNINSTIQNSNGL